MARRRPSAKKLEAAVRQVTTQPVRWVINTGGQDHRWLGNEYFRAKGVETIAHATASRDMQSRGGDQVTALRSLLGVGAEGTIPSLPIDRGDELSDAVRAFDGKEFRHLHNAHELMAANAQRVFLEIERE